MINAMNTKHTSRGFPLLAVVISGSLPFKYVESGNQGIAGACSRICSSTSGNLIESTERDARQVRQAMKVSKAKILDGRMDDGNCFHVDMLPLESNFSSSPQAIYEKSNLSENLGMDYSEIRRRNIEAVVKDKKRFKTQRAFAEFIDEEPSHVNGWIKGSRDLGWPKAREIEIKIGLRPGWLDEEEPQTNAAFDLAHRFMNLDELHQAKLIARLAELEHLESLEKLSEELRLGDAAAPFPAQEYKNY